MSSSDKTRAFLEIAPQFKLGHLETESFHPKTQDLSNLVRRDIKAAHKLLQDIDQDALILLRDKGDALWGLSLVIQDTLAKGHKVFMCGCGATGRLSLVLETLFRQKFGPSDQVLSFMAGGDYALIKSVESFEDKSFYGERQLIELGFGPDDLLIASSEGGETPFVIGAVQKAAISSSRKPYFLYCNPDELLMPIIRSKEVLEENNIVKVNLTVGPMAISGSTRMQASTVLMLGIGVGLLYQHRDAEEFHNFFFEFLDRLSSTDYSCMAPFTLLETNLYKNQKYLNYITDSHLAISILTDTTERSPTFSLKGFENLLDQNESHALAYLFLPEAQTSDLAWERLLWRSPRPVEWVELNGKISLRPILGFDISKRGMEYRSSKIPTQDFSISYSNAQVTFSCGPHTEIFSWGEDPLFNHLMIKMLLNSHSTLIMGLLGRYEGNVMTWVRPSNNKLIDRAARYILQVLKQNNKNPSYEEVIFKIYDNIELSHENESIVMKVVEHFNNSPG